MSKILKVNVSPAQDDIDTVLSLIVVDSSDNGKCWKLNEESDELTEFTKIPDCLFRDGIGICVYEDVGLILTGGIMDMCAVYQATTNTWQTMEQKWVGRNKHASVCIHVSTSFLWH